jgi:hypothetical protein
LLFALDPWAIIDELIDKKCPRARRDEAFSCIEQAKDFYIVGTERNIVAAREKIRETSEGWKEDLRHPP